MGQMPGVSMLPFTDALLYAPPEQLREPDGYLEGKGYAWDNYAFAVIAFRLLTGKFPRCEATFHKVAPKPGESHVTGIEADVLKIAERLEHRELEGWSSEAADALERKRRGIIQKCLSLNPEDRYSDMTEVLRAWDDIDADARAADEKAGCSNVPDSANWPWWARSCWPAVCVCLHSAVRSFGRSKNKTQLRFEAIQRASSHLRTREHRSQSQRIQGNQGQARYRDKSANPATTSSSIESQSPQATQCPQHYQ